MSEGKDDTVMCAKHPEKRIEYFCRQCHHLVCPKCMFHDHNGHELAQLDEVTVIVKQNITDLHKLLLNTKRINDDNSSFIDHMRDEVGRIKEQQLSNIDKGFGEVIQKLEQKRDQLKEDFTTKYHQEHIKFEQKSKILEQNNFEITNIESIYEEL